MTTLHTLTKSAYLIKECTIEGTKQVLSGHPMAKVSCTFTNPGTVTTPALPWVIAGAFILIGLAGVGLGEAFGLNDMKLYSSNVFTAGMSYVGGMVTIAMQKKE